MGKVRSRSNGRERANGARKKGSGEKEGGRVKHSVCLNLEFQAIILPSIKSERRRRRRIHPSIGDGVKEGEVAKGIQVQVLQFK